MLKVNFKIARTHHLSRFARYLTKTLHKEEVKALNYLVKSKDLVIQKAAKGNMSKINNILQETSKFKKVNIEELKGFNHLIRMEERITRLLKSLEDQGEISEKEKNDLYTSGSKPGVLYGPSKINRALENGIPSFYQTLPATGIHAYKLAKFCDQLLKPFTKIKSAKNDSFSFAKDFFEFGTSLFMASFDIKSHFINIPLTETLSLCV